MAEGSELLEAFCGNMTRRVDDAIKKIEHLYVKQGSRVRPSLQQLITAVENASSYVKKVADFTFYCSREERMNIVIPAGKEGNFQPLGALIDQLQRCLEQAKLYYKVFVKYCSVEAEKCKHGVMTAQTPTQATTVGAAIGGVVQSFFTGLFTVAAVAAGSTVAGGTARDFEELSGIFYSLASDASDLYSHVLHLHTILEGIATALRGVDTLSVQLALNPEGPLHWLQRKVWGGRSTSEVSDRVERISAALESLYRDSTVAHTTRSRCRDSMNALGRRVRNKM